MRTRLKRLAAWFAAFCLLAGIGSMAGCGQEGSSTGEDGGMAGNGSWMKEDGLPGGSEDDGKAMGRYLEEEDDVLKEELHVETRIARMEDGSLAVMSRNAGKWLSFDNGVTWEEEELAWLEERKREGAWFLDMAAAKDGQMAVIYETGVETDAGSEAEDGDVEDGDGQEGIDLHMKDFSLHLQYAVIAPDGTWTELEISYKDGEYINHLAFSEDGRLFGSALDGRVYEIDRKTGKTKEVADLSRQVSYMTEKDGKLMLVSAGGVTIVNLSSGETIEDTVLDDFLKEQFGENIESNIAGTKPLLLLPGKDGVIYLALDKGIYRHVIGGNVMEQVVDGSLTSLGNPSYGLADGIFLEEDVFLLVYSSGEIMRYIYDPDIPAVPDIRLKAYSLKENGQLKTVISAYQANHPEVYIQYEIGMDESLAATREDALKKLNTEIAAGKGPDLFILDDMPIGSYKEKGVLMDLSPYLEDKKEDQYFTNIIHAFWTPEGTYAVPGQFRMALLVGGQDEIENMADLESIARTMEDYRKEGGEGLLFGARSEEEMLSLLLPVCAPAWKDEEGKPDQAALEEFYKLAKRMWDVEKEGVGEEQKESYERWLEDMAASGITEEGIREYQFSAGSRMIEYLSGRQKFVAGTIGSSFDFDVMISCFKIKGKTDSVFASYNGQAKNVFLPDGLVGISASCSYPEIALELLEDILDDGGWNGMPVNKEKCRERFLLNATEDGGSYGSMGTESADGKSYLALDIYPASDEEITKLLEIAAEGSTPYIKDTVLENAVYLAGVKALAGEMDASAAAEEVILKTSIYMSE